MYIAEIIFDKINMKRSIFSSF